MAAPVIAMELLEQGTHADPRHGSNVLELASVLAGDRWSANPDSVHPALAAAADAVNDLLTDERRRLLVPLAPWLLGTNSADSRVWPAVASVCIRAATPSATEPDLSRLLAELDRARTWFAGLDAPHRSRRRGDLARLRDRQWALRASCSALARVAASADPESADTALCQALVNCVNECRRLAGKESVDPRLPLADCPQRLLVQLHAMWSPGCDWMELGYQPASAPQPARVPAAPAQRMNGQHPAATT
ncbi:MAG TPA: hypothetical protein VN714_03095 [Trebonia sp.]|nr:hypothetical protein [Trebonia sp.]